MTSADPTLRAQITAHEGVRTHLYADTVGKQSIGVGRNITDVGLRDDEIQYLLTNDLNAAIADLEEYFWFHGLDAVRQRVLIDMRFQLGAAGLRAFSLFLAAVGRGDYERASKEMGRSQWATQVPSRARALAVMMRTGQDEG